MCPIPESTGKLISVQSEQMWGEILGIKDTLLPFDNPKGWTRPQGTGKIPISTI
jgi:hypothetical protein